MNAKPDRGGRLASFYDPAAIIAAIPISIVVAVGSVLSIRSHQLQHQDRQLVVHSYQVMRTLDQLLLDIDDAETGQRGFIITGKSEFLEPFLEASRRAIPHQLAVLGDLVKDNAAQARRAANMRALLTEKMRELAMTVQVRRQEGFDAAEAIVAGGAGKKTMDEIRGESGAIEAAEADLLRVRSSELNGEERRYLRIAIVTVVVSTLVRIGVALWRRRVGKI